MADHGSDDDKALQGTVLGHVADLYGGGAANAARANAWLSAFVATPPAWGALLAILRDDGTFTATARALATPTAPAPAPPAAAPPAEGALDARLTASPPASCTSAVGAAATSLACSHAPRPQRHATCGGSSPFENGIQITVGTPGFQDGLFRVQEQMRTARSSAGGLPLGFTPLQFG